MTPIWTPDPHRIAATNLVRFLRHVQARHKAPVEDYPTLYRWSIEFPELFWSTLWEFCEIRAHAAPQQVLTDPMRMPGAQWFTGSRLNFAENLLRFDDAQPAIIFRNEIGRRTVLTFHELRIEVARVAQGLREHGVVAGDRVSGFMPNTPEAVIAMLATASLGAIWSSCSPDFGTGGVLDRFGQIAPKVLFAADGYTYAGKRIDVLQTVRSVVEQITSIERVVIVPYLDSTPSLEGLPQASLFGAFGAPAVLSFTPMPFASPLYILYSSGTTGAPKCIVHSAGGTLVQHLKEHVLHVDLKRDDRIFFFTTCGWMMWNWLVSSLATGATVVLYDGSPMHPQGDALWRMVDEEQITIFGTSPRYLAACEKTGLQPRERFSLNSLKTILSTGAPLPPEGFAYVYRHVKSDVQLSSISGGTDIIGCFALGCPTLPVYEGELQCRALGMKVQVFDEQGRPLDREKGELVCTAPFPSMPIGFWNDPKGKRYHEAYFARFPHVWHHGDFAQITERGGVIIYGRSDAVLNPGGVRIGTAEIYRQVERIHEVLESAAIAQQWQNDVRVVLFVRLRSGLVMDDALRARIRESVRVGCSPRHVPAKIIQVPDLPRTLSGKLVELAIRNVVHNQPVKNTDALANPEALEHFRDLPELRTA